MTPKLPNAPSLGKKLVKMSRPQNMLYPGLLAFVSCYITTSNLADSLLCYLFVCAVYVVAACTNNINDVQSDRLNKRTDNPLAYGALGINYVRVLLLTAGLILVAIQLLLKQPVSATILLAYFLLVYAYSTGPSIMSRSWLAPLLLAVCYGVLPLLLGVGQGSTPWGWSLLLVSVAQLLLHYPFLLAKDYKDYYGDKMSGKHTPLVRHGEAVVRIVAQIVAAAGICVCIILGFLAEQLLPLLLLLAAYAGFVVYFHALKGRVHFAYRKACNLVMLLIGTLLIIGIG